MIAPAAKWVAETLFELGHKAAEFSRKRGVNDEDHWYPTHYKQLGLLPNQCYHCGDVLQTRPVRGCRGPRAAR